MEVPTKVIERIGDLLIEGGKFLCLELSRNEARSIFGTGEEPRTSISISNDLLGTTRKGFSNLWYDIAKEARGTLYCYDEYIGTISTSITALTSIRGRRGIFQGILRSYVGVLNRYMQSCRGEPGRKLNVNTSGHRLEGVARIIAFLESYGIRAPMYSPNHSTIIDRYNGSEKLIWLERDTPFRSNYDTEGEKFVGMESDVELLVDHLVMSSSIGSSNVFAICGLAGLGKTAMAKHVLNHPRVQENFSASASVQMSDLGREGVDIQREILGSLLSDSQIVSKGRQIITKELIRAQENRRCLVVLDDMRTKDQWDQIKDAFPIGLGTKFLVTTRDVQLATYVNPKTVIYRQRVLNEEESWELFKDRLNWDFLHARLPHEETKKVEEIGRKMIRRCHGIPFPIVTLAKLMRQRSTLSEWKLLDRIIEYYIIGDIDMGNSTLSQVFDFSSSDFSTSYQVLPDKLKSCFLYLCNLPRDSTIDAEKLFLLWIAEGFVSSDGFRETSQADDRRTLMCLAEYYLNVLEQRSMVRVRVDESTGRTKSFRLPEIIQEMCLVMSVPNEYMVREKDTNLYSPRYVPSPGKGYIDRLAICLQDHRDLDSYIPPDHRTAGVLQSELFLLQSYKDRSRISRKVQSHLSDLKLVIILDLGGLVFSKLDRVIGNLIHLKYLGLRYAVFHELPSTIANMKSLQTLDIRDDDTQYASVTLPSVLWSMSQLKFIYLRSLVGSNKERDKLRCGNMQGLEIFENFDSRVFNVEDLFILTNLRRLRAITAKKSDMERITDYLESRTSHLLEEFSLSIKYCDLYSEEGQSLLVRVFKCPKLNELSIHGRTGKLPMYENDFSIRLTKITLENCELKDDPMVTLEKLPNLWSLFVMWNAFAGKEMVCSATGFRQLRILQLRRMWRLEKWLVEEGGMPNLSSLEIISCPALEMIPDGLQYVTDLKEVVVGLMPESFTNRLRVHEGGTGYGDDRHKLRHASIKILYHDGKEETVHKNKDAITGGGVVIGETEVSTSRTISGNNTRLDKGKGKAAMTESYAESATDKNEDEFMHMRSTDMENIWQCG